MSIFGRLGRRLTDDVTRARIAKLEGELMEERARRVALLHSLKLVDGLLSSGKSTVAQSQLRAILIREGARGS